jgi:hypothetical protein
MYSLHSIRTLLHARFKSYSIGAVLLALTVTSYVPAQGMVLYKDYNTLSDTLQTDKSCYIM